MIKIRPHHLLDIIRDFGNDVKRDTHPWGASLPSVTDSLLSKINQKVEFVMGVDSICKSCFKLNGDICEARINNNLLMRDYNDRLDQSIFSAINIAPGSEMPVIEFLRIIYNNIEILNLFNSPSNILLFVSMAQSLHSTSWELLMQPNNGITPDWDGDIP